MSKSLIGKLFDAVEAEVENVLDDILGVDE